MRNRSIGFVVLFLTLGVVDANAQSPRIDRIEIYEPGIYQGAVADKQDVPSLAAGAFATMTDFKLSQSTTTIPARLGTRFGYKYKIFGEPVGATVNLQFVGIYPAPGIRNPQTQKAMLRDEVVEAKKIFVTSNYDGYSLDNDWEVVPGVWVFQIWYQGRKLAEQSFTVVKP
jgi:Domain of unknown function (DUF3859)